MTGDAAAGHVRRGRRRVTMETGNQATPRALWGRVADEIT